MNFIFISFLVKMNTRTTYNRTELQQLKEKTRKQSLMHFIDQTVSNGVIFSAQEGKTEYLWPYTTLLGKSGLHHHNYGDFTNEELIAGIKEKFPDTTVEYQETWIETRPGVKEQKKGFLIDWS